MWGLAGYLMQGPFEAGCSVSRCAISVTGFLTSVQPNKCLLDVCVNGVVPPSSCTAEFGISSPTCHMYCSNLTQSWAAAMVGERRLLHPSACLCSNLVMQKDAFGCLKGCSLSSLKIKGCWICFLDSKSSHAGMIGTPCVLRTRQSQDPGLKLYFLICLMKVSSITQAW